jgi:hypothetical protein
LASQPGFGHLRYGRRDHLICCQEGKNGGIERVAVDSGTYCTRLAKQVRETLPPQTWAELFESVFSEGAASEEAQMLQSLGNPEADDEIWRSLPCKGIDRKVEAGLIRFARQQQTSNNTGLRLSLEKRKEEIRLIYDAYSQLCAAKAERIESAVLGCIYRRSLLPAIGRVLTFVRSALRGVLVFEDSATFSLVVELASDFAMFRRELELRIVDDAMTSQLRRTEPVAVHLAEGHVAPRRRQTGTDNDSVRQMRTPRTPTQAGPRVTLSLRAQRGELCAKVIDEVKGLYLELRERDQEVTFEELRKGHPRFDTLKILSKQPFTDEDRDLICHHREWGVRPQRYATGILKRYFKVGSDETIRDYRKLHAKDQKAHKS